MPVLALAATLAFPVGWLVTDHLEEDNAFCVSCHLSASVPLHRDNHGDFGERPPVSLAAAHAAAGNESRPDGAFRCIDCHGGDGWAGRARVKLLSARDALWYVVGRFEEPEGMRWPLWDRDCVKCHDHFAAPSHEPWEAPPFHALAVHNRALGVGCVECHGSHEHGDAKLDFLQPDHVRSQCARCHSEFEETLP
ncbi:MAG: hypothetical protein CL910_21420 [Deltaproteobacteria bacterium]|nr:hypothetical protein [Deltaproteobacteria bacterium]